MHPALDYDKSKLCGGGGLQGMSIRHPLARATLNFYKRLLAEDCCWNLKYWTLSVVTLKKGVCKGKRYRSGTAIEILTANFEVRFRICII